MGVSTQGTWGILKTKRQMTATFAGFPDALFADTDIADATQLETQHFD